jgi:hypothetical protein
MNKAQTLQNHHFKKMVSVMQHNFQMLCQESTISQNRNLLVFLMQIASINLELKSKNVLDSWVLKYRP